MIKLKTCAGCGEDRPIWKNHAGEKYCKVCWSKKEPLNFPKSTSKPKAKSDKKAVLDGVYSRLRLSFLEKNPYCKAKLKNCSVHATDVHHMMGRGSHYLNQETWIALCRSCHQWCELNPLMAKDLGFSKSRIENE